MIGWRHSFDVFVVDGIGFFDRNVRQTQANCYRRDGVEKAVAYGVAREEQCPDEAMGSTNRLRVFSYKEDMMETNGRTLVTVPSTDIFKLVVMERGRGRSSRS